MDYLLRVQVGQPLQDLGQVVNHDPAFLLEELYAFGDGLHELEEIAVRTQLHHHPDVVFSLQHLVHANDSRMRQSFQQGSLDDYFMHLLQPLQSRRLQSFKGKYTTIASASDSEDLPV